MVAVWELAPKHGKVFYDTIVASYSRTSTLGSEITRLSINSSKRNTGLYSSAKQ